MLRFLAGVAVGAFSGVWFLGWLLTSSRETETAGGVTHALDWQEPTPAT
jgi:hypothetical protein